MMINSIRSTTKSDTFEHRDRRRAEFADVEIKDDCGMLLERGRLDDLSTNGAKIRKATQRPIPKKIILLFVNDGFRMIAEKKWQKGHFVGVEFDKPFALPEILLKQKSPPAPTRQD